MDRHTRQQAVHWHHQGLPAIVVEVVQVRGSAPRAAGTRMVVSAQQAKGTIGGGHLELHALRTARHLLQQLRPDPPRAIQQTEHLALGPSLGQCCGGSVELRYRILDEETLARWGLPAPLCHLQLFGAGHVGRAIVTLLETLDITVDWIDERESEFPPASTSHAAQAIRRVCVDAVEDEVRHAPPQTAYLVMTHQHDLDLRITEAILRRGDARFVGLIGSRTKRQRFIHHLERRGLSADAIRRLTCPIGMEGIRGKQPEIIAVAVVAQLLQHVQA